MRAIALMNDEDKFNQVADDQLDQIVAENMDRNTVFGKKYFDNSEFQTIINELLRD